MTFFLPKLSNRRIVVFLSANHLKMRPQGHAYAYEVDGLWQKIQGFSGLVSKCMIADSALRY